MLPPDPIDRRLLDGWQRDFPLVPRPFRAIAEALGVIEAEVLDRLDRLSAMGAIGRVGGICRPNTLGASTLAAMAVPGGRVDAVAAAVAAEPGVNHSYLREDDWNLWFVMTAPDRAGVEDALARIGRRTGLRVLDLPLVTAYHIDLGFPLAAHDGPKPVPRPSRPQEVREGDRALVDALCRGLPLVPRPFAALADRLGRSEDHAMARVAALLEAGILTRLGIIVRHRPLGWRANAMTVWDVAPGRIDACGRRLAGAAGVTLCYRRRPAPQWPYALYCMVHGRSREETLGTLDAAEAAAGLGGAPRRVLFSTRCFRQRGAMVEARQGEPA